MIYIEQTKKKHVIMMKYLGMILFFDGLFMLMPLAVVMFYPQEITEATFFSIPSIACILIGAMAWKFMRTDQNSDFISIRDSGVIIVFAWVTTCLVSTAPFVLSGQLNFSQAMFESVSGWTTTGLSVINVEETMHIYLMWRSIMQFLGGAGIAVIMLASIIGPTGTALYSAEGRTDLLLPNITKSAKMILIIYMSYTLAGILLYISVGMPIFDAINHAMTALSTGGFSTVNNSIGTYNSIAIEMITIILMLAGTINFGAHYLILNRDFKQFIKIGEIRFMFIALSIAIPITFYLTIQPLYFGLEKSLRVAIFEIVSALSTTGFSTVGYNDWNEFGVMTLIILMIIGGGTGSTAGGLKQYRVYILLRSNIHSIRRFFLPEKMINELEVVKVEGKKYLDDKKILEISHFVMIYIIIYLAGVSILVAHGYDLIDSMFEFASCIGTVGLSIGITSPYAPIVVLWTQTIGMFLGRLEILIVFYALIKIFKDFQTVSGQLRRKGLKKTI